MIVRLAGCALALAGLIACGSNRTDSVTASPGSSTVKPSPDPGTQPGPEPAPGPVAGPGSSTGPTNMSSNLTLKLLASPTQLSMKDRPKFKVGLVVENRGSAAVDPQLSNATLTVNKQHAYAWDLAIQNGPRDASWRNLAPSKSISIEWPLGEALFEKPGDYQLVLTLGGLQDTAQVKVTP